MEAGMKIVAVLLILCVTGCAGSGQWSREDTLRQSTFIALTVADWGQTRYIFKNPEENYYESNPLVSESNIDIYFPVAILAHTAIACALPSKYRKWWQYVFIVGQAGFVGHNASIGIGVDF
jgi:hypothetical protein